MGTRSKASQFSLGSLLLAIVVLGVGFSLFTVYQQFTPHLKPEFQLFALVYNLTMAMAFGSALGSVTFWAREWFLCGNRRFPALPGHWLLLLALTAAVINAVVTAVFSPSSGSQSLYWVHFVMYWDPLVPGIYHQCLSWGLGSIVCTAFWVSLRRRLGWPWLSLFAIAAACAATLAAWHALFLFGVHDRFADWWRYPVHIYAAFILVGILALTLILVWDFGRRAPTDWLHRMGIVVSIAIAVIQFAGYIRLTWII